MAFGINRKELNDWKLAVKKGDQVVFITHFWIHPKYPSIKTVTKAGSSNLNVLIKWGNRHGLKKEWIHHREGYPHFDLIGDKQVEILEKEGILDQIDRFRLK
ncbi:hypothetical protein ACFSCX_10830 [Bacillus salitolerans]|uniref:Uncharacterized protein n=1 Tax=Bacillus salitolerans TaxID=1437434 RepID=A0ABW4LPD9_9BACI